MALFLKSISVGITSRVAPLTVTWESIVTVPETGVSAGKTVRLNVALLVWDFEVDEIAIGYEPGAAEVGTEIVR